MADLVAGREMDALIAERVFGFVAAHAPCGDGLTRTNTFEGATLAECDAEIRLAYRRAIEGGMRVWPAEYIGPEYSTDIAAAWQIVDALEVRGWWVELTRRSYSTGTEYIHGGWSCEFRQVTPEGHGRIYIEAPTRELAICLAALEVANKSTLFIQRQSNDLQDPTQQEK